MRVVACSSVHQVTVTRELSMVVALIAEITGGVESDRLGANTTSTQ